MSGEVSGRLNRTNVVRNLLTFVVGLSVTVGIQWLQFGIIYPWVFNSTSKKPVERDKCVCSCWDTWFKGYYEDFPGQYHHVYFNTDIQTGMIWFVTMLYVLLVYG